MILPLKNSETTQPYGRINPAYRKGYHTGIDYAARGQDKSVYAATAGTVIRARFAAGSKGADPNGWGNYVIVRASDGHDLIHAHLASVAVVQGMTVKAGERLGIQGSTGNSTGPHLHFEVRKGDWAQRQDVDPVKYLQGLEQEQEPGIKIRLYCQCGDLLDTMDGVLVDGKAYGPVRPMMERYGHSVTWDGTKVDIK
jgi:murein DD-endopeptidase MepM/ murein hydrolase activator NlpD